MVDSGESEGQVAHVRRKRWPRRVGAATLGVALAFLLLPLVWPVPALTDTVPPSRLADEDSRFLDVDGVTLHYKEAGSLLAPQTVILLHGFGASTFSYRDQLPLLGDRAHVIAFDRPGFGLTGRPLPGDWTGIGPYGPEANADQVVGLMDALDIDKAVVVGHSAGAAVAVLAAVNHPDRIEGLVLEAPAIYQPAGPPAPLDLVLRGPQSRRIGPLLVRRLVADRSDSFIAGAYANADLVTAAVLEGYRLPLRANDWDKGLWEVVVARRSERPADVLSRISVPTLVIAGTEDAYVPLADSVRASKEVSGATLARIPDAGHIPHEERPEQFANEVFRFLDTLPSCFMG